MEINKYKDGFGLNLNGIYLLLINQVMLILNTIPI